MTSSLNSVLKSILISVLTFGAASMVAAVPVWANARPDVVGGHLSDPPGYFVSLSEFDRQGQLVPGCGGTLISDHLVVTAAHCVDGYPVESIVFGVKSISEFGRALKVKPKYIFMNAGYDSETMKKDIALIVIGDYDKSQHPYPIKPISIAQSLPEVVDLKVTGFGNASSFGELFLPDLMAVAVPRIPTQACRTMGESYSEIDKTQICAGELQGRKDSCQGDSGGPLVFEKNGITQLAGVVSFGEGCALSSRPGVYTNAVEYGNWIHKITDLLERQDDQLSSEEAGLLGDAGCLEQDLVIKQAESLAGDAKAEFKMSYFLSRSRYQLATAPLPAGYTKISSCQRRVNSKLSFERTVYADAPELPGAFVIEIKVGDRTFRAREVVPNYKYEFFCSEGDQKFRFLNMGIAVTDESVYFSSDVSSLPDQLETVRECTVQNKTVSILKSTDGSLFLRQIGALPHEQDEHLMSLELADDGQPVELTFRQTQSSGETVSGTLEVENPLGDDIHTWQIHCSGFEFSLGAPSTMSATSQVFFAARDALGTLPAYGHVSLPFRAQASLFGAATPACEINGIKAKVTAVH